LFSLFQLISPRSRAPTFSITPTISLSFRKIQGRRDSSVPAEKCASEKETPGSWCNIPRAKADSIIKGGEKILSQKFTVAVRKAGSEVFTANLTGRIVW